MHSLVTSLIQCCIDAWVLVLWTYKQENRRKDRRDTENFEQFELDGNSTDLSKKKKKKRERDLTI